jgi:AraC-like DNA-binding protein
MIHFVQRALEDKPTRSEEEWRDLLRDNWSVECEFDRGIRHELRAASWFMSGLRFEAVELSGQHWTWKPGPGLDNWRRNTLVILLTESGVVEMEQEGSHVRLNEGSLMIFDGSIKYTQTSSADSRGLILRVSKASLETRGRVPSGHEMFVADATSPDVALFTSLIAGATAHGERCSPYGSDLFGEHITDLMAIVTNDLTVPTRISRSDAMLRKAKRFIDRNFGNEKMDVGFVASAIGISPRYLARLFAYEDSSVRRYLLQRRLARAQTILTNGDTRIRISDIAWECGFVNAAHFSRIFKNHCGASPKDFRRTRPTHATD